MSPARPNVLFVMADQLSARTLPAYGNAVVDAPNLAALARAGVVFESAYCNSPLCAPSRASLLTGQLVSALGAYDNGADWPASVPTVAHYLRASGYFTCLAGKMHFLGPDQLHGFDERLTTDVYTAGIDWVPDWTRPLEDRLPWYHDMSSVVEAGVSEATLRIYRSLREDGLENVGVVLQSYLYRSEDDLRSLLPLGPNVRIVKGAYLELPSIAYPKKRDVDAAYRRLLDLALAGGAYTAAATHDEQLIAHALELAGRDGCTEDRLELQMLYGVRPRLQADLATRGCTVRIATPFGPDWYPYLMRRLAERPANLLFFLRSVAQR